MGFPLDEARLGWEMRLSSSPPNTSFIVSSSDWTAWVPMVVDARGSVGEVGETGRRQGGDGGGREAGEIHKG